MGITASTPSTRARAMTINSHKPLSGELTNRIPLATMPVIRPMLTIFCPENWIGRPGIRSLSLPQATRLPVNVTPPIKMDRKMIEKWSENYDKAILRQPEVV